MENYNDNIMDLSSFSTPRNFDFKHLSDFKFGGVYIISSIDEKGNRKIVKIGESNFIYRRIANYLSPLEEKDKTNPKKVTKRTIQKHLIEGKNNGLTYEVCWKVEEDVKIRKGLEKKLISEFKRINNEDRPLMNRIDK